MTATWEEFERLELAVGRVVSVEDFSEARRPAYKLVVDFGPRGTRRSSAQITHYPKDGLLGRQVVCVLGFEPERIARCEDVDDALIGGRILNNLGGISVLLGRPGRPSPTSSEPSTPRSRSAAAGALGPSREDAEAGAAARPPLRHLATAVQSRPERFDS